MFLFGQTVNVFKLFNISTLPYVPFSFLLSAFLNISFPAVFQTGKPPCNRMKKHFPLAAVQPLICCEFFL